MSNLCYNNMKNLLTLSLVFCGILSLSSCEDDEVNLGEPPIPGTITYPLAEANSSRVNGYIRFYEIDGVVEALIQLAGTESGNSHPAQIRGNSAIEGGEVEITLEPVDGRTGESRTTLTGVTMEQLQNYDGYAAVLTSANDETIVAQSDIGSNELTENSKEYDLALLTEDSVSGTLLFEERKNGFTKVTISLENTVSGGSHPAHIHQNTAVETGGIAISFNPVNGTTGISETNVRAFDGENGEAVTYAQLLEYDGYVNVHLSEEALGTVLSQVDIGQNELSGDELTYDLEERAVEGISGTITMQERLNGEILATIALEGTPEGGNHPAHIHQSTYAEGGAIVVSFNPVNGTTGMSKTNISAFNNGDEISLEMLGEYDGYVNVHLSAENLETIVAQTDIGANALTGESVTYNLDERDVEGISGIATLYERNNGNALMIIDLEGTPEGGSHPAHIHANTAAEGGGIVVTLSPVDGTSGESVTTIRTFDDGSSVSYAELLEYDGYVNAHLSSAELGTIVAQGDVGQNALTGDSTTYVLNEVGTSGVSGTATFYARNNGFTLVELALEGTAGIIDHPAHIHFNSAEEGGDIAIDLSDVDSNTGISRTNVEVQRNNRSVTYENLLAFDGYINVHASVLDLATILAQGNIGANIAAEE